ncbi:TPA: PqqD family protein [Candidatus Poribacteria bacterium]|nr:PqqD family protein [Candidatus Poribacteria bacterium]
MNFIRRFLIERRRKKSGLQFNRDDILKSRPVRNSLIKWEQHSETKIVSLTVPQKEVLWIKIVSKIFMLPKSRVIVLDEVGSFVWTLCDGYNSIDTIVRALCNKYKLTRKEAETSLLEYFRRLGKRGIIGFAVLKKDQS